MKAHEFMYSNFLAIFPMLIYIYYFLNLLLQKEEKGRKVILFAFITALLIAIMSGIFSEIDEDGWLTARSKMILYSSLIIIVTSGILIFLKGISLKAIAITILLIEFFSSILSVQTAILTQIPQLMALEAPIPYLIANAVILPLLMLPFSSLLKKIQLEDSFNLFFRTRIRSIGSIILILALFEGPNILPIILPQSETIVAQYVEVFNFFILIATLSGLAVAVFYQQTKEKLASQQALLLQQESYLKSLEDIQSEMKMLQHDYKNMISGLYLQADAGKSEEIKEYLSETLNQFDGNITKKLTQTTQIKNIEVMALKSLVITKLLEMEKNGIPFELEVLKPVEKISMDINNLNRCLGILLDNAIEATKQLEALEPIKLIVSSEDQDVTIIVKNAISEKPLLHRIAEKGYSTKENNTGIGLFSLQKITDGYSNVLRQTICDGETFTQILTILK